MFSLIETAHAMTLGGGGAEGGGAFQMLIPFVLIFGIFYFMMIRPQQKKAKAQREMNAALSKGDEVVTDSGIYGTVQRVGEHAVTIEIAPKVAIRVVRSRISERIKESKGKPDKSSKQIEDAEDEDGLN